jgi:hypothetical protein
MRCKKKGTINPVSNLIARLSELQGNWRELLIFGIMQTGIYHHRSGADRIVDVD